jgi:hypothetical protein
VRPSLVVMLLIGVSPVCLLLAKTREQRCNCE